MNLQVRARAAMEGFMCGNPEETPDGHRLFFGISLFPSPVAEHIQWDDGDGTARALDAWLFVRRLTGDLETGRNVEDGHWRYLRSLLNPRTGLVYVRDLSVPNREGYYYHLWDQGRTFRHLVNRYASPLTSDRDRPELESLIRRMIGGLRHLETTKELADGSEAVFWSREVYMDDTPEPRPDGNSSYGFAIGCAQMLEPAVAWAAITGAAEDLDWAIRLANGFIAGLENRRESTTPMFGPNGEFRGHFHCVASGMTGLVRLSQRLLEIGGSAPARTYLDHVVRAYEWVFSEENRNRGGSHGWIPESSANWQSNISEICCTVDMIELASALASTADLSADYQYLDRLWDAADRFARNELYQSQILHPEKLERWVFPKTPESRKAFLRAADRVIGGWPFGHTWPHDLMDYDKDAHPDPPAESGGAGAGDGGGAPGGGAGADGAVNGSGAFDGGAAGNGAPCLAADHKRFPIGGCCMYSGPRGLAAYLDAAIRFGPARDGRGADRIREQESEQTPEIDIRLPLTYGNERLSLAELPSGGVSFSVKVPHTVRVRAPSKVDPRRACLFVDGHRAAPEFDSVTGRVVVSALPGRRYSVTWPNPVWESHETLGSPNDGRIRGVPVGSRVAYKLSYEGGQLKDMDPCGGACLPYKEGL